MTRRGPYRSTAVPPHRTATAKATRLLEKTDPSLTADRPRSSLRPGTRTLQANKVPAAALAATADRSGSRSGRRSTWTSGTAGFLSVGSKVRGPMWWGFLDRLLHPNGSVHHRQRQREPVETASGSAVGRGPPAKCRTGECKGASPLDARAGYGASIVPDLKPQPSSRGELSPASSQLKAWPMCTTGTPSGRRARVRALDSIEARSRVERTAVEETLACSVEVGRAPEMLPPSRRVAQSRPWWAWPQRSCRCLASRCSTSSEGMQEPCPQTRFGPNKCLTKPGWRTHVIIGCPQD